MGQRWRQDAPDGPCLVILRPIGELSWVWLEALGAILGHRGEKLGYLGQFWRQVGTVLAGCWDKDGEDGPT